MSWRGLQGVGHTLIFEGDFKVHGGEFEVSPQEVSMKTKVCPAISDRVDQATHDS